MTARIPKIPSSEKFARNSTSKSQFNPRLPRQEHDYGDFVIRLIPFLASISKGTPRVIEHCKIAWVEPSQLLSFDFAAADIPVARYVMMQLE